MAFVAAGGAAEGAGAAAGDQAGLARAIGRGGSPAPSWVKNNPGYFQAYRAGLDELRKRKGSQQAVQPLGPWSRRGGGGDRRQNRRASRAGRTLANTRPSSQPRRRGYVRRAFSPRAAAQRLANNPVMRAGDGGGLLLAFVLYPMFRVTVMYGAAGPGMWFKAKWLNQGSGDQSGVPAAPEIGPGHGGSTVLTPGKHTYWHLQHITLPNGEQRPSGYIQVDPTTGQPVTPRHVVQQLPPNGVVLFPGVTSS